MERDADGDVTGVPPELGVGMAGSAKGAHDWKAGGGVPPFPGWSMLPGALTPGPPKLDPDEPDRARALLLVRLYRACAERRFKKPSFPLGRVDVQKSKHYAAILECARALLDHDVAPAAWVAFSFDVWRDHSSAEGAKKAPPLRWVFSASRVSERAGWFASEESSYCGGRAKFGPSHNELIRRHAAMRAESARTSPQEAAAKYFPDGLFERLVAEARVESRREQARLREAVARGEWIWEDW